MTARPSKERVLLARLRLSRPRPTPTQKALRCVAYALTACNVAVLAWRAGELLNGLMPAPARIGATLGLLALIYLWMLADHLSASMKKDMICNDLGGGTQLHLFLIGMLFIEMDFYVSPRNLLQSWLPLHVMALVLVLSLLLYGAWRALESHPLCPACMAVLLPLGLTLVVIDMNAGLNGAPTQRQLATVAQKRAERGGGRHRPSTSRRREVLINALPDGTPGEWMPVTHDFYGSLQPGQPVCLASYAGALGARWAMLLPAENCPANATPAPQPPQEPQTKPCD